MKVYKLIDKVITKLLRLPKAVVFLILAPSFIFSGMFTSGQSALAAASSIGIFANINMNFNLYTAFILFGLIGWLTFEVVVLIYFILIKNMMGASEVHKNKAEMVNILRWFFILRNIIFGCLRLLYFKYPLAVMLTENVVIFGLQIGLLVGYYFYIRKKYIAPQLYPRSVAAFCAPYLLYLFASMIMSFAGALSL